MLGIGILFSELAYEAESSLLEGIWPYFLILLAVCAAVAIYFALRPSPPKDAPPREEDADD